MYSHELTPVIVFANEPQAPAGAHERTRAEIDAARSATFDRDPHFLWLLDQRNASASRIRAAIVVDQLATGTVSERVLNLIRGFKEDWQDFRFGDLIPYDDVFEDSDHG